MEGMEGLWRVVPTHLGSNMEGMEGMEGFFTNRIEKKERKKKEERESIKEVFLDSPSIPSIPSIFVPVETKGTLHRPSITLHKQVGA